MVKCEIRPPVFLGYLQCVMTFLKELLLSLLSPGPAPHCMLVSITGCPWPVMCTERRIENSPTPTLHDNKHKNRKLPQNSCTLFSVCKFSNNENYAGCRGRKHRTEQRSSARLSHICQSHRMCSMMPQRSGIILHFKSESNKNNSTLLHFVVSYKDLPILIKL